MDSSILVTFVCWRVTDQGFRLLTASGRGLGRALAAGALLPDRRCPRASVDGPRIDRFEPLFGRLPARWPPWLSR